MEEMKNNQTDEVVEQRPSTKYGRTAYQEQLRQEQLQKEQQEGVKQTYSNSTIPPQSEFEQNHAYQTLYTQQPYTAYQEQKAEVKNLFAYILMILIAGSAIVNYMASMMTMEAFNQVQSMDINAVLDILIASTGFTMLSYIGDMFFWVSVVFFVLDIMALYKAGKKIVGAILFAILLRPAYFIWRAHLLGQKKVVPIIYTVCYYGFCIFEYITIFAMAFEFASQIV